MLEEGRATMILKKLLKACMVCTPLCTVYADQLQNAVLAQPLQATEVETKSSLVKNLPEEQRTLPTQNTEYFSHKAEKISQQVEKAQQALKQVKKTTKKLIKSFSLEPKTPLPSFTSLDIASKTTGNKIEIPVCISASLEGKNSIIGSQIHEGMQIVFNNLSNDQPDTRYFIQLFSLDDKSEPVQAKENIKQLEKNSPLFLSMMGDNLLFTSLTYLLRHNYISLFPISGVNALRNEKHRNLVFFRPSYEKEIEALVTYAVYRLRRKKIAVFYEESDWGNECQKQVIQVLKKFDIKPVVMASYPEDSVNVADAIDRIAKKAPNVIFCIATPRPASTFVRLAINKGLYNSVFLGFSELVSIQKVLNKLRGARMVTSAVVPDPLRSNIPLAQEFRIAMQKYLPNEAISPFHFEGYINAVILMKILNSIPQLPITTEKIITSLEGFNKIDLKGLVLSFDPTLRTLSDQVWINKGQDYEFIPYQSIKMDE